MSKRPITQAVYEQVIYRRDAIRAEADVDACEQIAEEAGVDMDDLWDYCEDRGWGLA